MKRVFSHEGGDIKRYRDAATLRRRVRPIVLFLVPIFFLSALQLNIAHSSNLYKYQQILMGTVVEITLVGETEEELSKAALQAFQEIKRIEWLMSQWIESSDISQINRSAGKGWVKVSPETTEVIKAAQKISELSEGGFDVTVGPLVELWRRAREKGIPPSNEEVKRTLKLVNFKDLLVDSEKGVYLRKEGMSVDLGGIAKGYAVDKAFERLRNLGYKNLIVNAGGDLRAAGSKFDQPWTIGIQHPRESQKIMAKVSISDEAIATSGDYEKFFTHQGNRYHHILNPKDGFPTVGCQSVTVIGKDGMTTDGFATAVFVLGPERGYALCEKLEGVECLIVDKDGRITFSPGLKDRISFTP
jgi:thiamine biosynthesis lipoprotein